MKRISEKAIEHIIRLLRDFRLPDSAAPTGVRIIVEYPESRAELKVDVSELVLRE